MEIQNEYERSNMSLEDIIPSDMLNHNQLPQLWLGINFQSSNNHIDLFDFENEMEETNKPDIFDNYDKYHCKTSFESPILHLSKRISIEIEQKQLSSVNSTSNIHCMGETLSFHIQEKSQEKQSKEQTNKKDLKRGTEILQFKAKSDLKPVVFEIQMIRPLQKHSNYYLIGDIAIDFQLLRGKESRYSPLSEFRPIIWIERDLSSQFVEIELGQYQQGMTDFRCVIEMLNSMNDQFAHGIAILLMKYQKIVDFKLKMNHLNQKMVINKEKNLFDLNAFWQEAVQKAKEIVQSKRQKHKFLAYIINKGTYLESTMIKQGYSEQLLEVLGLNPETFKQISMRKGLIDFVEPLSRYFIIIEQFSNFAKNKMPWEEINLISIDNFKIPVRVQAEKITLNKYKCYENYIGLLTIEIQEQVIEQLKINRYKAQSMLADRNLFSQGEEFSYSFETELFLEKFYPNINLDSPTIL